MKEILVVLLCLVFVFGSGTTLAQQLTGEQILDELKFSNVLSSSGTAELTLITENDKGVQRKYFLRVLRESNDGEEKQFLEYLGPADVRGTKFLSVTEKDQEDQMWLYLPAIGRERRIAAHMTGDSFMGTDFTYEEIGGNIAYQDEYAAKRSEDQDLAGVSCYVLELTSIGQGALYEKIQMWVWKEEMIPVQVEFWSPVSTLKKTLTLKDFRLVDEELIPHYIVMADKLKGTRTILEITMINQETIDDEVFTVRYLRR